MAGEGPQKLSVAEWRRRVELYGLLARVEDSACESRKPNRTTKDVIETLVRRDFRKRLPGVDDEDSMEVDRQIVQKFKEEEPRFQLLCERPANVFKPNFRFTSFQEKVIAGVKKRIKEAQESERESQALGKIVAAKKRLCRGEISIVVEKLPQTGAANLFYNCGCDEEGLVLMARGINTLASSANIYQLETWLQDPQNVREVTSR